MMQNTRIDHDGLAGRQSRQGAFWSETGRRSPLWAPGVLCRTKAGANEAESRGGKRIRSSSLSNTWTKGGGGAGWGWVRE